MKHAISTNQTPENITKALELLDGIPQRFATLDKILSPEQLTTPIADGECTPTEALAHVLHCEARVTEYIYQALILRTPLVTRVHPERDFGKLINYSQYEYDELMTYFSFRRKVMMTILNNLDDKQWSRDIRQANKKRQETVYLLVRGTALHEDEHIRDIHHKLNLPDNK